MEELITSKIKKILCFLNIHIWEYYYKDSYFEKNRPHRKCLSCGLGQRYNEYWDGYLNEWQDYE